MLYHYTSTHHLPSILGSGFLKLTDSMLKKEDMNYKPVVWLTTQHKPDPQKLGLVGSIVDKSEVKIHVPKQKSFQYWLRFSRKNKIDENWAKVFETNHNPKTWWISENIITLDEIELIENRYTGQIYYSKGEK